MALFAHPGKVRYSGVSQTYCFIRAMCSSKVRAKCAVSRYVDLIRWINSCSLLLARFSLISCLSVFGLEDKLFACLGAHTFCFATLQRMCYVVGESGKESRRGYFWGSKLRTNSSN